MCDQTKERQGYTSQGSIDYLIINMKLQHSAMIDLKMYCVETVDYLLYEKVDV